MKGTWVDHTYRIGDVDFIASPIDRFTSSGERFCLVKRPDLVENYVRVLEREKPKTIVELGIFQGGSAALFALVAEPDTLVAIEKSPERLVGLDEFVESHQLGERVHLHYGVDQSDRATLASATTDALGSELIDLVIDDASHLVEPTRASFNELFPRLRPGGLYVIEDWSWAHIGFGAHRPDETPLTRIVFELTLALPSRPGMIEDISIDHDCVFIRRGPAEIDAATFDISSCYSERGRALLNPSDSPSAGP